MTYPKFIALATLFLTTQLLQSVNITIIKGSAPLSPNYPELDITLYDNDWETHSFVTSITLGTPFPLAPFSLGEGLSMSGPIANFKIGANLVSGFIWGSETPVPTSDTTYTLDQDNHGDLIITPKPAPKPKSSYNFYLQGKPLDNINIGSSSNLILSDAYCAIKWALGNNSNTPIIITANKNGQFMYTNKSIIRTSPKLSTNGLLYINKSLVAPDPAFSTNGLITYTIYPGNKPT